ncbi:hypothetical protein V5799_016912 [Amblyomma americanum]|uniref:Cytosolic endo-beta-N-acetylglucosaminidase TIM barrel domain-containing protein n=1 Tax=Amblyomma americanum TaxID=6943 RepID=A0AAQ4F4Y6_AMBAM
MSFKKTLPCAVEPLKDVKRDEPKILFCLDMTGGSQDDRFIDGCDKSDSYRFHHWQLINSFVYCSHHLVTIPPPGWVSAGHKHGVNVLVCCWIAGWTGRQLQPRDQGHSLCDGCGVAKVCTEWAYNGGGCLLLRFTPDAAKPRASPYFRLFACDIPLGSLSVSYAFQIPRQLWET